MTDQSDTSGSEALREQLQTFDVEELRETITVAQDLLAQRLELRTDELEIDDAIVRVEERPAYTEVVRREPQGQVLYHVVNVSRPDGDTRLDWRYIGPVED